ncbi:unnamed protein product [Meganyctiphanes norvegica]|uniref:EGF-like domain-containing protein n=1 Tax=Meganyctiphanes norvegica TaxID=48144 RepID=A0AAV2RUS1_MEGNR
MNSRYECYCKDGYTGSNCRSICQTVTCPQNSQCHLMDNNKYQCVCNDGYAGPSCQSTCLLSGCPENAECILTMNSQYECVCKEGYTGYSCQKVNIGQGDIRSEWQLQGNVGHEQNNINASTIVAFLVMIMLLMLVIIGLVVYAIYQNKKYLWSSTHKSDDGDNLECQAFPMLSDQSQYAH